MSDSKHGLWDSEFKVDLCETSGVYKISQIDFKEEKKNGVVHGLDGLVVIGDQGRRAQGCLDQGL